MGCRFAAFDITSMTTAAFKVKLDLPILKNFLYSTVSNEFLNSAT